MREEEKQESGVLETAKEAVQEGQACKWMEFIPSFLLFSSEIKSRAS